MLLGRIMQATNVFAAEHVRRISNHWFLVGQRIPFRVQSGAIISSFGFWVHLRPFIIVNIRKHRRRPCLSSHCDSSTAVLYVYALPERSTHPLIARRPCVFFWRSREKESEDSSVALDDSSVKQASFRYNSDRDILLCPDRGIGNLKQTFFSRFLDHATMTKK